MIRRRFQILLGFTTVAGLATISVQHLSPGQVGYPLLVATAPAWFRVELTSRMLLLPLPARIRYAPDHQPVLVSGCGFDRMRLLNAAVDLTTATASAAKSNSATLEPIESSAVGAEEASYLSTMKIEPVGSKLLSIRARRDAHCKLPTLLVAPQEVRVLGGGTLLRISDESRPRVIWDEQSTISFLIDS